MTAERDLRQGSFRGVKFETTQTDLSVGRRTQIFEYPQRDKPFVEDLGRSVRTIKFNVFVTGDDYITAMNKLIAALEQPGPGELVHPWLGTMSVIAQTANNVTFSQRLRVASATLEFVESGEDKFPASTDDTGFLSRQCADRIKNTAIESFVESFNLSGVQDFVRAAVSGNLNKILSIPGLNTVATMFDISSELTNLASNALSLINNDPRVMANTIANSLGLSRFATTANDWRRVSRQLSRIVQKDEFSQQDSREYHSRTTSSVVHANSHALEQFVRQTVVAQLVGASSIVGTELDKTNKTANAGTMAHDELLAVREEVLSAIDVEMLRCDDDAIYETLEAARAAVFDDMTSRAENYARLIDYTPPEVMPAIVIAYDLYDDATRDAEIIERNSIRHGGFVPARTIKILSE